MSRMGGLPNRLVEYVVINAGVLVGAVALARPERLLASLGRLVRAVSPAPAPAPAGLPIERIAADLRLGVLAAYDDALVEACTALELVTTLADLPVGMAHDLERLRVEEELRRSGLVLVS